jgi:hypothetical protein
VKALLKHFDTCHASPLVMGVLSNMCAYGMYASSLDLRDTA